MENKMAEVAKLFGVELNEEFGLKNSNFRYKLTSYGLRKRHTTLEEWTNSCMLDDLLLGKVEIVKMAKPILDEKEKEYLSAVIKPFRNSVVNITKLAFSDEKEYILIELEHCDFISLPCFKARKMYKDMKTNREYTLEQSDL